MQEQWSLWCNSLSVLEWSPVAAVGSCVAVAAVGSCVAVAAVGSCVAVAAVGSCVAVAAVWLSSSFSSAMLSVPIVPYNNSLQQQWFTMAYQLVTANATLVPSVHISSWLAHPSWCVLYRWGQLHDFFSIDLPAGAREHFQQHGCFDRQTLHECFQFPRLLNAEAFIKAASYRQCKLLLARWRNLMSTKAACPLTYEDSGDVTIIERQLQLEIYYSFSDSDCSAIRSACNREEAQLWCSITIEDSFPCSCSSSPQRESHHILCKPTSGPPRAQCELTRMKCELKEQELRWLSPAGMPL